MPLYGNNFPLIIHAIMDFTPLLQSRGANSALINAQPQDFVVVNGNTYRITRSKSIGLNDTEEKMKKID